MINKFSAPLAVFLFSAGFGANAATLDFSSFGVGEDVGTQLVLPEATITATDGTIQVRQFGTNGFCFFTADGCTGAGSIAFSTLVEDIMLDVTGLAPGESVAYDIFGPQINSAGGSTTANGTLDLSVVLTAVSQLDLDAIEVTGQGGAFFQNVSFGIVVPVPATLPLILTGLVGGFGWMRRQAKRNT